jgi:hypothetical protein
MPAGESSASEPPVESSITEPHATASHPIESAVIADSLPHDDPSELDEAARQSGPPSEPQPEVTR